MTNELFDVFCRTITDGDIEGIDFLTANMDRYSDEDKKDILINATANSPSLDFYKHILDSADKKYAGCGTGIPDSITAVPGLCDYKDYSITMTLPPYGAEVFVFQSTPQKKTAVKKKVVKKTK